jgi:hypothetical protein
MVGTHYKKSKMSPVSSSPLFQRLSVWVSDHRALLFRVGLLAVLSPVLILLGMLLFSLLNLFASVVLFLVVAVLVIGCGLMVVAVLEDRFLSSKSKHKDQTPAPPAEDQVIDVVTLP